MSHYGVDGSVVLIAERGLYEEDETKGQEEPLAPWPTLDLSGLMSSMETELPFTPHRGPGAFEKSDDAKKRIREDGGYYGIICTAQSIGLLNSSITCYLYA